MLHKDQRSKRRRHESEDENSAEEGSVPSGIHPQPDLDEKPAASVADPATAAAASQRHTATSGGTDSARGEIAACTLPESQSQSPAIMASRLAGSSSVGVAFTMGAEHQHRMPASGENLAVAAASSASPVKRRRLSSTESVSRAVRTGTPPPARDSSSVARPSTAGGEPDRYGHGTVELLYSAPDSSELDDDDDDDDDDDEYDMEDFGQEGMLDDNTMYQLAQHALERKEKAVSDLEAELAVAKADMSKLLELVRKEPNAASVLSGLAGLPGASTDPMGKGAPAALAHTLTSAQSSQRYSDAAAAAAAAQLSAELEAQPGSAEAAGSSSAVPSRSGGFRTIVSKELRDHVASMFKSQTSNTPRHTSSSSTNGGNRSGGESRSGGKKETE